MKKKIYCFNNGGSNRWYYAMAMAEDGTVVGQHICSDPYFMKHDLGLTSNWKHENYNQHYGEGNWELVWVDDPLTHEGLQAAYELNQKNKPKSVGPTPGVTVEFSDGTKVRRNF
jgi:hypothetical protein